jgi:hypothetical protein
LITIPTPPTDNLYKFLAISGVILVAVSLFTPAVVENEGQDRGTPLKKDLTDFLKRTKDESGHERELIKLIGDVVRHDLRYKQYIERLSSLFYWGGGIAAVGFSLWYWKIQRFQDRILRCEYEKLNKSIQSEDRSI